MAPHNGVEWDGDDVVELDDDAFDETSQPPVDDALREVGERAFGIKYDDEGKATS